DAAGGNWPKRARKAATELVGAAKEAEPSLGVRLLADLKTVFDKRGADKLATSVVLTDLVALPESPWGDLKGRPVTGALPPGSGSTASNPGMSSSRVRGSKDITGKTSTTLGSAISPLLSRRSAMSAMKAMIRKWRVFTQQASRSLRIACAMSFPSVMKIP